MYAKWASACEIPTINALCLTHFLHVQSRNGDTEPGLKSISRNRNGGDSLGDSVPLSRVVQSSKRRHVKKIKQTQCWELGPTLCLLQGLTASSSMDWTPFSSWIILGVFLKQILHFSIFLKEIQFVCSQSHLWCEAMHGKWGEGGHSLVKAHWWSKHKNAGAPNEC